MRFFDHRMDEQPWKEWRRGRGRMGPTPPLSRRTRRGSIAHQSNLPDPQGRWLRLREYERECQLPQNPFRRVPPPLAQAPLLRHVTAQSTPLGACASLGKGGGHEGRPKQASNVSFKFEFSFNSFCETNTPFLRRMKRLVMTPMRALRVKKSRHHGRRGKTA